ncbi:hypothetical protein ANAPC5_00173 [Anaplasma phagocytophilum]|nr:hypothetical protein ANAPC4_00220 [Anaplasma phagocytophilum]SBO30884.1 hypothetical protein ANAPC2_00441 [Anaplasma phagocytophilum]SBO31133.1 hypothetical protein ANAPC3_00425 [Anaplasma phagocytophilum]SBO31392.1 hypothetical protein ANAPC3_00513 [Anaplasma phagocytophilum]SCV62144.1 hypothetical protein ANAPC5_00173 [Anaplasma phagocytophilum]
MSFKVLASIAENHYLQKSSDIRISILEHCSRRRGRKQLRKKTNVYTLQDHLSLGDSECNERFFRKRHGGS